MADEAKSESSGGGGGFLDALFWIMVVSVAYLVLKQTFGSVGFSLNFLPDFGALLSAFFGGFQVFSIFISLLFLLGTIYFTFKTGELHAHHDHGHDAHSGAHGVVQGHNVQAPHKTSPVDPRWEKIESRLNSIHDSDWRLAIIDCDIILGEMLVKMGYKGETIAEKLKQVEQSDFTTIQSAWEAHKIRNQIAHAGSDFRLSFREAKRVVGLYKKVFEEFYYI